MICILGIWRHRATLLLVRTEKEQVLLGLHEACTQIILILSNMFHFINRSCVVSCCQDFSHNITAYLGAYTIPYQPIACLVQSHSGISLHEERFVQGVSFISSLPNNSSSLFLNSNLRHFAFYIPFSIHFLSTITSATLSSSSMPNWLVISQWTCWASGQAGFNCHTKNICCSHHIAAPLFS